MTIIAHTQDHVLTLTLNRFDKKNALTAPMYKALDEHLIAAASNHDIHTVIIQGNDSCFCAGNDLHDFMSATLTDHPLNSFLITLATFPKTLIAAVAGPAIGIGTTLLFHCDHVVAASNSVFQMPFSQLGLCPEAGSSLLLGQYCGARIASELLVLGNRFDCQRAEQLGIINQTVEPQDLLSTAAKIAQRYASLPLQSTMAGKQLIKAPNAELLKQHIHEEVAMFTKLLQTEDCQKAVSQFFKG